MTLDLRTVFISGAGVTTLCALLIAYLWWQHHSHAQGLGLWLADFLLQAVSVLLIGLRGVVVPELPSILLGTPVILAGTALLHQGIRRYLGRPYAFWVDAGVVAVAAVLQAYFTLEKPDLGARNVLLSAGMLVICAECAIVVLRYRDESLRPNTRLLGLIFVLFCVVSAVRIGFSLGRPVGNDFFASGSWNALAMLVYHSLYFALPFALVLLVTQRVQVELARDIDARRRTEQALRESETRFFLAFQSAPHASLLTRPSDGTVLAINAAFTRLVGYRAEEALGKTTLELGLWADAQDREALLSKVDEAHGIDGAELVVRRRDGKRLTTLFFAHLIVEGGARLLLSSLEDVTDRKRAEAALREAQELFELMLKHTPIYSYIKEVSPTESRVVQASENFAQMVGVPGSQMIGKTMPELFPPEFAAKITADDWAVVSEGKMLVLDEQLNGRSYTTLKFPARLGERALLFGHTLDITDRKRAEDEIRRLNQDLEARVQARTEQLEAANRALGLQRDELGLLAEELRAQNDELGRQKARLAEAHRLQSSFLSNMTHELRTPLNSVITLSSVLARRLASSIPAEEHGYLGVIERNGRSLLETINDVLDYARLEAGRELPRPERFELAPLVQELVAMLEPHAREKGITLAAVLPEDLPALHSDRGMCRHILQNLLANAVKFTHQGRVELRAEIASGRVCVAVADTGIGIAPELHQVIFEEFRQADESTARQYGGTGLGLAIARRYATLLGATIDLASVPGQGSTFTLALPASPDT